MTKTLKEAEALLPDEPGLPLPEPPIAKDHLIRYVLSGYMLILARDTFAATRIAGALLHTTIGSADEVGVTPQQASRIRLNDLQIGIDSVEAIEFLQDESDARSSLSADEIASLNKAFPIGQVSRMDLQQAGFDANWITDEQLGDLADKLYDDYLETQYWESMVYFAKEMGLPQKPEGRATKDEDDRKP